MDAKDEIKSRLDIVDYVGAYVRLQKRGQNWLGLCPFHSERTPSFNVSREKRIYKCYGCGEGGDIFSFAMKMEGLNFREAMERLAEKANVKLEERANAGPSADVKERARAMHAEAAAFYAERLWATPDALEYARRRGLNDDTLRDFQIGWAPDEWEALTGHLGRIGWTGADLFNAGLASSKEGRSYYDRFRGRLMFPIFDVQNRVVAFGGRIVGDGEPKYLNSSESPLFNKSKTLYALNRAFKAISADGRALVMEGYMDVVAAHQAGFSIAIATLGTSLTQEHVGLLKRYTSRVVLAYDADGAGVKAALRAGPMFEEADLDVRLLVLPPGEDPDSYLKSAGAPAFAERVENAVPLMDFQLSQLRAQQRMDTEDGRTAYVQQAIPLLAAVRSNVTRDRYVRQLAEVWAQGDMARVAYREDDIRKDLSVQARRAIAAQRAAWRAERDATKEATGDAPTLAQMAETPAVPEPSAASAPPSGLALVERELLRALLHEPDLVRSLHVTAEEFTEGAHRQVAGLALATAEENGGAGALEDVGALPESIARLVTELHLADDPPVTKALVEDAAHRLRIHAGQRRRAELHEYIQKQDALRKDDPLVLEWQSLQRQSRVSDRSRVS